MLWLSCDNQGGCHHSLDCIGAFTPGRGVRELISVCLLGYGACPTGCAGKLSKPYGIVQAVSVQSSNKLDTRKVEFTWNVKIGVTYKKPYYDYPQLR